MKAYFVDTNVLIDIMKIFTGQINSRANRYYQNYADFINLIGDREVQVLIVPTVLEEIRRGSHKDDYMLETFILRMCEQCELTNKELELVDMLYKDYIQGEESAIPVFKDMGDHIKYNDKDARILAEIVVLYNSKKYDAIKFITNNIQDFINIDAIKEINEKYNLKMIPFNSMRASNVKKEIR